MPSPTQCSIYCTVVVWWSGISVVRVYVICGCLLYMLSVVPLHNALKYCIYSIVYSYSVFPVLNYYTSLVQYLYILLVAESKSMVTLDDCQKLGLVQSSLACQYGSTCFSHNTTTV